MRPFEHLFPRRKPTPAPETTALPSGTTVLEMEAIRALSSIELMEGGARLEVTENQMDAAKAEMELAFKERNKCRVDDSFLNRWEARNILRAIREQQEGSLRVRVVRSNGVEEDDWFIASLDRETDLVEVRKSYLDEAQGKNAYHRKYVSLERLKSWNKKPIPNVYV